MPSSSPPRTDRRAAIVRAAYQLVAERGLEGFRFADVARDAGINNGTLLYYFPSKDALIRGVADHLVEEFRAGVEPRDPAGARTALAELRWEFADARPRLRATASLVYLELLARAPRDPAVADLLRAIDADWHGWLASVVEAGRRDGSLRPDADAELAASMVMAVIRGVGMQSLVAPADPGPTLDALATLIERWLAPASAAGSG